MEAGYALQVRNLGKQYQVAEANEGYDTLRDQLVKVATEPFQRASRLLRGDAYAASAGGQEIWALKDVSFDVKQGEVIGIIGHNGAGKSTLLKIVSRITDPTTGYIDIRGRIGSLLEVGTGFHPELTGQENVYLNGMILGMSQREVKAKYNEIVEFAEIGKFMNTPVKRYSSGMRLRLGFAVAAYLEPEILVIDEVLAVGDAAFQKKCINKMSDVAIGGRTILFVSHNMSAINQLCARSVLLKRGELVMDGPTSQVAQAYLSADLSEDTLFQQPINPDQTGQIVRLALEDAQGQPITGNHDSALPFDLVIDVHAARDLARAYLTVSLRDIYGTPFLFSDIRDTDEAGLPAGVTRLRLRFTGGLFAPGVVYFTIALSEQGVGTLDVQRNILVMRLFDFESERGDKRMGYFGVKLQWEREGTPTTVSA